MDKGALQSKLGQLFPIFDQFELKSLIAETGQVLEVEGNQEIIDVGDYIFSIPLVLEGSIKVSRKDPDGREVLMYYITPGQSCAITLASSLKQQKSPIKAVTQEPSKVIALPINAVYKHYQNYHSWQLFVIDTFNNRFNELLAAFDKVAFHNLDKRLLQYLKDKADTLQVNTLHISHQEIASDLATSREVISRLLKQMENKKLVQLARNKIVLM